MWCVASLVFGFRGVIDLNMVIKDKGDTSSRPLIVEL